MLNRMWELFPPKETLAPKIVQGGEKRRSSCRKGSLQVNIVQVRMPPRDPLLPPRMLLLGHLGVVLVHLSVLMQDVSIGNHLLGVSSSS